MKNQYKFLLMFGALLMVTTAFAQGAPPATPIDGGLGLLLAGGAAYGVKKLRDHRRK